MPPRGNNEGLDFTPILTHYLFLFTSILAVVSFIFIILSLSPHRVIASMVYRFHRTSHRDRTV